MLPLLLALAGCLSSQRTSFYIAISDVAVADAATGPAEVTLTVTVSNQEVFSTVVERDVHRIWLGGVLVGETSGTDVYGLPPLGVVKRTVKLAVPAGPALDAARAAARGGVEYRIETRLHTNSGGDKAKVDLNGAGMIGR